MTLPEVVAENDIHAMDDEQGEQTACPRLKYPDRRQSEQKSVIT
jgi:hypothetical protein